MNLRLIALRRVLPWLSILVGSAVILAALVAFRDSPGFGYDYLAYDAAARRLAAGEPLYPAGTADAYNAGRYGGLYLYPPPLAVAIIPLTALNPEAATVAWLGLRIGLLAIGCAILPVRRSVRIALWLVATISFPVLYDLNLGNVSIILFFLSAAMWRWNGTPTAGIALAAAIAIRYPFGLVGIAWILTRRWSAVAATVVAGVGLVLVTLPFVGLSGWLDYAALFRALEVTADSTGVSLGSIATALGLEDPWPWVFTFAGLLGSLGAVMLAARRRDADLALVVALAGTLLFAPLMKPPYLVALLIPAAYVANRGHWWGLLLPLLGWLPGDLLGLAAVAGIVAPLLVAPAAQPDQLAAGTSAKRTARAPSS